ncbi:MAG: hypothetical protein AMJ79_01790 [Phycisphaerae bacterium SM23_30]|nr:MAG: hypothetical protein AMJ79_01790 [Phycisphaerae bacterium SM23_30]
MERIHQPRDIHREIVEFIDSGRSFAVALVLEADGSTPAQAGGKAIIDESGKIWGTIGGGAVELETQRRAVEVCKTKSPVVFEFRMDGANPEVDGAICGGAMRILIDPTMEKHRDSFAQAAQALQRRSRGVLLTSVRQAQQTEVTVQWFSEEDLPTETGYPGIEALRSCLKRETPQLFVEKAQEDKKTREVLVEPIIPRPLLLIAGGGHVGQALARQASLAGFDIVVIDDRAEFTNPELFPEGVITRCGEIPKEVSTFPIAQDTFIVIVTHEHKYDADTLQACIHAPAAYIGMIGSKRKVALIRKNLMESGAATEEEFSRVFAPIGLDIAAVTVPEIAASIVAQLITVRRRGKNYSPPGDMVLR